MIDKHVADAEIQQYALDMTGCSPDVATHMRQCADCRTMAENYKLLFSSIKQAERPAFDFDLSAVVLNQLPADKPRAWLNGYLFVFSVLAGLGIPAYFYQAKITYVYKKYVLEIISGVSSMVISFLIVTIAIFIIFQCVAMYKRYRQKVDDLNFY